MISPQSYHALQFFSVDKALPDDELPDCLVRDFTRIKLLLEQGLIFSTTLCPPNKEEAYPRGLAGYYLSAKGVDAISEFERISNEQAERKKQQRFSNKLAVLGIFVPLITFILGLVVEHYSSVVGWFVSLF